MSSGKHNIKALGRTRYQANLDDEGDVRRPPQSHRPQDQQPQEQAAQHGAATRGEVDKVEGTLTGFCLLPWEADGSLFPFEVLLPELQHVTIALMSPLQRTLFSHTSGSMHRLVIQGRHELLTVRAAARQAIFENEPHLFAFLNQSLVMPITPPELSLIAASSGNVDVFRTVRYDSILPEALRFSGRLGRLDFLAVMEQAAFQNQIDNETLSHCIANCLIGLFEGGHHELVPQLEGRRHYRALGREEMARHSALLGNPQVLAAAVKFGVSFNEIHVEELLRRGHIQATLFLLGTGVSLSGQALCLAVRNSPLDDLRGILRHHTRHVHRPQALFSSILERQDPWDALALLVDSDELVQFMTSQELDLRELISPSTTEAGMQLIQALYGTCSAQQLLDEAVARSNVRAATYLLEHHGHTTVSHSQVELENMLDRSISTGDVAACQFAIRHGARLTSTHVRRSLLAPTLQLAQHLHSVGAFNGRFPITINNIIDLLFVGGPEELATGREKEERIRRALYFAARVGAISAMDVELSLRLAEVGEESMGAKKLPFLRFLVEYGPFAHKRVQLLVLLHRVTHAVLNLQPVRQERKQTDFHS